MWDWWRSLISGECPIELNAPKELLIEKIIQGRLGRLSSDGAICLETLEQGMTLHLDAETFIKLKQQLMKLITLMKPTVFISDKMLGDELNPLFALRVVTTSPMMALQCEVLYASRHKKSLLGELTIYHWSLAGFPWKEMGLPGPVVHVLHEETNELLLIGDSTFQDVKSLCMNFLDLRLGPHHLALFQAAASFDEQGQFLMFVGHKGSGKSTLARAPGLTVYADDQVVLAEKKMLRLERGCFTSLKSYLQSGLSLKYGDVVEGGRLDDLTRSLDFDARHEAQNCFVSSSIPHPDRRAKLPRMIFFLCEDETGVLPAVSKLSLKQVQVFSQKYLGLHAVQCEKLNELKSTTCWLINTGYYGGPVKIGKRFPLAFTKACIHSILSGGADHYNYFELPGPALLVPHEMRGVRSGLFNPLELWPESSAYNKAMGAWSGFFLEESAPKASDLSQTL